MFATYEAQQIGELFSKSVRIGTRRIHRGLFFCAAILFTLGASGQVVRAASPNLDPTLANGGNVLNATPRPTETPHFTPRPTETPHFTPRPTETPEPSETPEPTETPHATHTPRPTETPLSY